ncbi:hydrolase [Synergistales bacterium]|nr:hydrolase [Synergistales bacterium]
MKLLVTDIDDTLSVGDNVSGEVSDACASLVENGWDIMIASGRSFFTAKNHIKAAHATQPAILYDGARTMNLDGSEIESVTMNPLLVSEVLKFLWPLPSEIQIACDEFILCRADDAATSRFYKKSGVEVRYIDSPSFMEETSFDHPVYRVALWATPDIFRRIEGSICEAFDRRAEIVPGGTEFLDILAKGVSKGDAFDRFLSRLPARPEIIVVAGDHLNDIEILRRADIAAAPENAHRRVLEIADFIMPTAREDGIKVLAKRLLSGE